MCEFIALLLIGTVVLAMVGRRRESAAVLRQQLDAALAELLDRHTLFNQCLADSIQAAIEARFGDDAERVTFSLRIPDDPRDVRAPIALYVDGEPIEHGTAGELSSRWVEVFDRIESRLVRHPT